MVVLEQQELVRQTWPQPRFRTSGCLSASDRDGVNQDRASLGLPSRGCSVLLIVEAQNAPRDERHAANGHTATGQKIRKIGIFSQVASLLGSIVMTRPKHHGDGRCRTYTNRTCPIKAERPNTKDGGRQSTGSCNRSHHLHIRLRHTFDRTSSSPGEFQGRTGFLTRSSGSSSAAALQSYSARTAVVRSSGTLPS